MRLRGRFGRIGLGALILSAIATLPFPAPAAATTYPVNTTADLSDPNGCISIPECSLREATLAANSGSGGDTITLPAGHYSLMPANGELGVSQPGTTIAGAGARQAIVDGSAGTRVFHVLQPNMGISPELTLRGLTVTNGFASLGSMDTLPGDGAGILNESILHLDHVAVSGNHAEMGGGGILAPFESGAPGGATTTIEASLIADNKVSGGMMDGQGGGIAAFGDLTIINSTVTGNTVGNPGLNEGGGIVSASAMSSPAQAKAVLKNTTVAGNSINGAMPTMDTGGGLSGDNVGGAGEMSQLTAVNTIIAGNTVDGAKQDCGLVTTTSSSHNLSSDASCGFADAGSLQSTNPQLGPLQDNGGETNTEALPNGSPAINAGDNSDCPATDQRGTARPQDVVCDIGAFEAVIQADLVLTQTTAPKKPRVGKKLTYTLKATNNGPFTATGVTLSDKLPAPVKKVKPLQGCTLSKKRVQATRRKKKPRRKLSCAIGKLAPSQSIQLKVVVRPRKARKLRNTALLASSTADPNVANDTATTKVRVKKRKRRRH